MLSRLHIVSSPDVIAHLGGETILREAGSLQLGVPGIDANQVTLHDVLAVGIRDLPAGVVALIGVADVRRFGLSLDFILANPGCDWSDALVGRPPVRRPARDLSSEDLPARSSSREQLDDSGGADTGFVPPTELESQRFLGMRRNTFLKLQARARQEQEERTATRIGRLFLGSPLSRKGSPTKRGPPKAASSSNQMEGHGSSSAAPAPASEQGCN